MRSTISVADPDCLAAVRRYADVLAAAGLPVRIEETSIDDGWACETAVAVDWAAAEEEDDDWEADEDDWRDGEEDVQPAPGRGLDAGQGRLAEHYLRTMRFLAGDVDAARAWIGRRRRSRKKKG